MKIHKKLILILLLCSNIIIYSCREMHGNKTNIFVSIQPQKFLVEKIGGAKVDVSVFVKSGMSPENFEPLPTQLIKLSKADIYFTIGFQFEDRIIDNLRSEMPSLKIVETWKNIARHSPKSFNDIFENDKNNIEITHRDPHGLEDPHIWLSPAIMRIQAQTIYETLRNADTTNSEYYKTNLIDLITEIDSVQKIISANLSGIQNRDLLVYHPAWGYFCDEFNLKQIPVEIEGKEPGIKNLSSLLNYIKANNIKFILAESQNSSPALNSIAQELGIMIVKHDPLKEDYFENLISLSEVIKENNLL